jgi:hypothetical protein
LEALSQYCFSCSTDAAYTAVVAPSIDHLISPKPYRSFTRSRPFLSPIHTRIQERHPVHLNLRGVKIFGNQIPKWEEKENTHIVQMGIEYLQKLLCETEIESAAHVNLFIEAVIQLQSMNLCLTKNCQFNHRFSAAKCFTPLVFLDLANRLAGHPAQPTYTDHPAG